MHSPTISAVITAYNEGSELHRTLRSLIDNTRSLAEVIVVDDGSQDGSCDSIAGEIVRVIRHPVRIGVAYSRDEGSRAARGDVLCYLDGHHRLSRDCLDRCARLALERNAITCPDIRSYRLLSWRLHGAEFRMCPQRGLFSARWREGWSLRRVSTVTGLRAPPYLIPRAFYENIAWSRSLRGWGGSEACVAIKAFFAGIPILHVAGPLARHRFQRQFTHHTTWEGVWRNHAIIARICFDDTTWSRHWLPRVFAPHLSPETLALLDGADLWGERDAFLARKVRADRQFWTDLLRQPPPAGI